MKLHVSIFSRKLAAIENDFKSRGGRDGVSSDNVSFFSTTHGFIFSSETLEWIIISLLSLILDETSKLLVCLDALVLYDIVFPKYF